MELSFGNIKDELLIYENETIGLIKKLIYKGRRVLNERKEIFTT